ncbi:MAG: phosphoribosyl-ATP diphosphatase [Actinomycetota bacterium]|nr:phosphoribosyl-ATP diphosphatase [Actinomycetota bacterium]
MTFEELFKLLQTKQDADPEQSNSAKYLALGSHQIGKKVIEEAGESWMAAVHESKQHTAAEIAQLLYWTALLAVSAGLELDDVLKEL